MGVGENILFLTLQPLNFDTVNKNKRQNWIYVYITYIHTFI